MRCPSLPLCGLLWFWLPLFYSRPVKIDKVKADTKNLTRTIIARIQEHQVRWGEPGGGSVGRSGQLTERFLSWHCCISPSGHEQAPGARTSAGGS